MITYTWNFNPLTCQTQLAEFENIVMTVHWQYIATLVDEERGTFVSQHIGTISFDFDPDAENFIPFDQLTHEIVQSWVEDRLGEDAITSMQESLAATLEEKINPVTVNLPAPWTLFTPEPTPLPDVTPAPTQLIEPLN